MSLSIHALDVGDVLLDNSFVDWQTNCGTKVWCPTTAYLVLGAEKPFLVDCSFRSVEDTTRNQHMTTRRSDEQTLDAQLAKHSLKCSDIGYLLYTHIHWDHAGQSDLVPNARILVQRKELQNAAAPDSYPPTFYDRPTVAAFMHKLWDRIEVQDGELEPFPGVRCVPMPGHTPGHQAVYVQLDSGTAILCGDAVMNVAVNLEQGVVPGFLDSMVDTMNARRRLLRDGKYVLPTHDPDVFTKYPGGIS